MAKFAGIATGNWSTAGTWNQITNTETLLPGTTVALSTSNLFTATYTAPNTTNTVTGVALYLAVANTSGGNITVTLQESTVDTAATVTVASSALPYGGQWVYFKFASPYTFTTTSAGAYRFKIVNSSASNTPFISVNSGGSLPAFIATDNRTGPPASTDDVYIFGNNGANTITVSIDGTQTIGSSNTSYNVSADTVNNAIYVGDRGILNFDTASSATLNCNGCIYAGYNGTFDGGSSGTPYPAANTATIVMGNGGGATFPYVNKGKQGLYGAPKSSTSLWKTKYVSGSGTAASPLVVSTSVDWSVGDEIVVGPTNGATHTEYRFIITKNSATSYVLSNTSGGSENALTNTHTTNADIINLSRNIIFKPSNTSLRLPIYMSYYTGTNSSNIANWVRFEYCQVNMTGNSSAAASANYCSFYRDTGFQDFGFLVNDLGSIATTNTGNVFVRRTGGGISLAGGSANRTFVDTFFMDCSSDALTVNTASSYTFTNPQFHGCGSIGSASMRLVNTSNFTFTNGAMQYNRAPTGIQLSSAVGIYFSGTAFGTVGNNTIDITTTSSTYNTASFENCTNSSTTKISNYANQLPGSKIKFYNDAGTHESYLREGYWRKQGTTFSTLASALEMNPANASEALYTRSGIAVNNAQAVTVTVKAVKNNAYGSSTLPYLKISGLGMTTDTDTFAQTTKSVTGATNATPIVVTSASHGYSNGDKVYIENVGGNTAANGVFVVANVATNTFELTTVKGANVAGNGSYTSGGNVTRWETLSVSGTPTASGIATIELGSTTSNANAKAFFDDIEIAPFPVDTGTLEAFYQGEIPPVIIGTSLVARGDWLDDPYVNQSGNEATALARTGISLNTTTGAITMTTSYTAQQLYEYIKAYCRNNAIPNSFFTTADGTNWALSTLATATFTANGATLSGSGQSLNLNDNSLVFTSSGSVGLEITNGTLILATTGTYSQTFGSDVVIDMRANGTFDFRTATFNSTITVDTTTDNTITAQFETGVSVTNNDAAHITVENSTAIAITNASLADGTRVRLYNVTQAAEIDNAVVSGGGGYSYNATVGSGEEIEVDDIIRIYGTYANGSSYKENYTEAAVASTTDITFIGTQTTWTHANALSVNGSAQTEFAADYPNVQVDVDATGNLFDVADLIGWLLYTQTTADGIRNFYGAVSSVDAANWTINTSVVDLYLDNVDSATATQGDSVILMRDDQVYPQVVPTSGGGGIGMIQSGLVFVTETGTSGLTSSESSKLDSIYSNTLAASIAAAVWGAAISSYNTASTFGNLVQAKLLTLAKFLALK